MLGGEVILFLHYLQQKENHFYAQRTEREMSLGDPLARAVESISSTCALAYSNGIIKSVKRCFYGYERN